MPTGLEAPQFKIDMLWLKWIQNGVVKQAWDLLAAVGSPNSGKPRPQIPAWTSDQGPHNLQLEVTAHNETTTGLNVKLRVQMCPRGISGLPPMPKPPCGDLKDSGSSVVAPGALVLPTILGMVKTTYPVLLPIWQLQMWSESVDLHVEIVDVDGTVYNTLIPYYDNSGYRADDFYQPIDVLGVSPGGFTVTVIVRDQNSGAVLPNATVDLN